MKEGRDQWLQPLLDQASDNNVAEIMDEDPLFIFTLPVLPENQKEWYNYSRLYGVFCLYFKNVFNYEDNDIFGVPLILLDYWTFYILSFNRY
jgi:acetyl-CoA synthetase